LATGFYRIGANRRPTNLQLNSGRLLDECLPKIKADRAEIQQVLKSLVQNAVEASDSAGMIDITASVSELSAETSITEEDLPAGRYVHIEVKDMGAGMSADVVTKAFDPFFTTKFLGRGLGLSAVLGIMRAHNGAVRLETAPNSGTTAHLFFPVDATEYNRSFSDRRRLVDQTAADEVSAAWNRSVERQVMGLIPRLRQ
jgi:signal transduction histidine kinase